MTILLSTAGLFVLVLLVTEAVQRGGRAAAIAAFGVGTPALAVLWWQTDADVTGFLSHEQPTAGAEGPIVDDLVALDADPVVLAQPGPAGLRRADVALKQGALEHDGLRV